MNPFDQTLLYIRERQERRKLGLTNCIPLPFERLAAHFPGIEQGTYYCVTANSGIGKSKFMRRVFVVAPVDWVHEDPTRKMKLFYFSMEESKKKFIGNLMSYKLYATFGETVPWKHLTSTTEMLTDAQFEMLELLRPWFNTLMEHVEIIDDIKNPTGIYKHVRDYARHNGTFLDVNNQVVSSEGVEKGARFDRYVANNPNEYVLIATDHLRLLRTEKENPTKHATAAKMSEYNILLKNLYNYSPIMVHQQAAEQEKQQFTYKGASILSKLEPSLDGLGTNKEIGQDYEVVFGLFAPNRYEIKDHRGYNIQRFADTFRQLSFLKMRDDESDLRIGLHFLGAPGEFTELPRADEMTEALYENLCGVFQLSF